MRFSGLALATSVVISCVSAAPFSNTTQVDITSLDYEIQRETLKYLHSNNMLTWKTANGGEVVFIPASEIRGALPHLHGNHTRNVRRSPSQVANRDIVSLVDNYKATIACFGSGYKVPESLIKTGIETACEAVLGALPGGPQLEQGWAIYKWYNSVVDDKGNPGDILFKYLQGNTPTFAMSEGLCKDAMTKLSDECTGDLGNSQGGTMGLGDSNYFFDVDPNQL